MALQERAIAPAMEPSTRPSVGKRSERRQLRMSENIRGARLGAAVLASFLCGTVTSQAYSQYTRRADCERWRENVTRWERIVTDGTGELTRGETMALIIARGGMMAVRDRVCGR